CGKPHPCAHSGRNTAALSEPRTSVDAAARSKVSNALSATEVLDRVERERWRREVVSRVQQHRARRGRFDPNASLDLEFRPEGATALDATATPDQAPALPADQDAGNAALGDGMGRSLARSRPLKIIRFPRQSLPDVELADPVLEPPRILDAPEGASEPLAEQMELRESFADIHMEASDPRAVAEPLHAQDAP